jgi:hypothetical protein
VYAPSVAEYRELFELGAVPLDPRLLANGLVEIRVQRGELIRSRVVREKAPYEDVRAAWQDLLAELREPRPP